MDHIEFRRKTIDGLDINPKLLGLASVEINPTELCNRTCSFCPRHDPSIYPNRNLNMSSETASVISSQLSRNNFKGFISIAGNGEPLLNPNILGVIKELSAHTIELITNADSIMKGKYTIDQLISSGISRVMISDYDSNPDLNHLTSDNVIIRNTADDGKDNFEKYGFNNRAGSLFKIESPVQNPCFIPSYRASIDWNGDVLLCSHDWSKRHIFGNIHNDDISDIWMSQKFTETRMKLITGDRHSISACAGCNVKGNIMGEEYAKLWQNNLTQ